MISTVTSSSKGVQNLLRPRAVGTRHQFEDIPVRGPEKVAVSIAQNWTPDSGRAIGSACKGVQYPLGPASGCSAHQFENDPEIVGAIRSLSVKVPGRVDRELSSVLNGSVVSARKGVQSLLGPRSI